MEIEHHCAICGRPATRTMLVGIGDISIELCKTHNDSVYPFVCLAPLGFGVNDKITNEEIELTYYLTENSTN